MSKSFSVAVAQHANPEEEELYEFTFSDQQDVPLFAYEPDEGQILVIMGLADADESDLFAISMAQKALFGMFEEESRQHIMRRLADRSDPLKMEDLLGVFERLLEAAGGRPTESLPASSSSRTTNGNSSTARPRRAGSTRSTSRSTGSSTTSTGAASRTRTRRSGPSSTTN